MSDEQGPAGTSLRTRIIVAVAAVAVLALVLLLVLPRLGDGGEPTIEPTPTAPAATESPSDAPAPDQTPAATDSGSPASDDPTPDASGTPDAVSTQQPLEVSLDQPAKPTDDLVVTVSRVEKVRSQAELPGETSRPALRITVRVENTSSKAIPIGGALTNVYYGPDREAASMVQRPGGRPFPASVAPGAAATSVVVYNVPPSARRQVVLEVSLDASVRRVEFSGNCASSC